MHSQNFNLTSVSEEDGYSMVAFGNPTDGSGDYVLLQLSSEFDQQDHDLGMDGVYLEINDQGHNGYKVVQRFELTCNSVTLHFSPKQLRLSDVFSPFCIMSSDGKNLGPDVHDMLSMMAARTGIEFVSRLS